MEYYIRFKSNQIRLMELSKSPILIAKKNDVKAQIFKKALTKCKYLYAEMNTVLSFKNKGKIIIKPKRLL